MSLCVLGDIHFRDDHPYFCKASEEFLKWFSNWERNSSNNSLILTGDLVESALLTGRVASYLERFYQYSNFKEIHICCGNHDKKKFHDRDQLAYEFYKDKPNVFVYETLTITSIEDKKVLMLPYYLGIDDKGKNMSTYYSTFAEETKDEYDLVVGHICGDDVGFAGSSDCVVGLDKYPTKKMILGHIHTRNINPNRYIGSVFSCKKNENDDTRSALILERGVWKEERLPVFTEFLTVSYPEKLPESKALVPIYTVLNCKSESIARQKYGDINIKRVTLDVIDSISTTGVLNSDFSSIKELDVKELLKNFFKDMETPYAKDIEKECIELLNNSVV